MEHSSLDKLVRKYRFPEPIFVSRPTMPDVKDYHRLLEQIWETKWLTNAGKFHQEFESRLGEYLGVEHICLFCNGTIALLVALHALRITSGEVITTPFTFPATVHVLFWNNIEPVFCDIDLKTFNLDPNQIEHLITPKTKAVLPVHVFGTSCNVEAIQEIADRHGLQVIYDTAHAFGVRYKDRPVVDFGDISMLSFHATKLFSTAEGGALIVRSEVQRKRINFLKNFGIADEETVIGPGINGKMSEFQAAFGLLQLDMVEKEIADRRELVKIYRRELKGLAGISYLDDIPDVKHNYSYFPILVDSDQYGMDRNELYNHLKLFNIFPRKYFYPLCSHYSCYSALPSARPENLPVAERVAEQVLCLPIYGTLDRNAVRKVCGILREVHGLSTSA
jgi:dTDP-4-amino-4,6-dideoxygalactose transaminase